MKGIILAGGAGTRLYPATKVISKQLLPIYDKPMIYYPLSTLMLAGIKDILIISTPEDTPRFKDLFKDGSDYGLNIQYAVQDKPNGLAEAFIIGEEFIGKDSVCLILGDNIFYGFGLSGIVKKATKYIEANGGARVYGYYVQDPERYGVAEFDSEGNVISIEEKPANPKSKYAVTGLYFYDNNVINVAKSIKPSKRGELEITAVNSDYLSRNQLSIEIFGRGFVWLDTGEHRAMLEASEFVYMLEKREGFKVACIEEIAYINGWISKEKLMSHAESMSNNSYGQYLKELIDRKVYVNKGDTNAF